MMTQSPFSPSLDNPPPPGVIPHAPSAAVQPSATPLIEEASPAASSGEGLSSGQRLGQSVAELLKNPLILAGGSIVVGIAIARIAGGNALKQTAAQWILDMAKSKLQGATPPAPAVPAPPAPQPSPSISIPGIPTELTEKILPAVGDILKKKLAELFRK